MWVNECPSPSDGGPPRYRSPRRIDVRMPCRLVTLLSVTRRRGLRETWEILPEVHQPCDHSTILRARTDSPRTVSRSSGLPPPFWKVHSLTNIRCDRRLGVQVSYRARASVTHSRARGCLGLGTRLLRKSISQ